MSTLGQIKIAALANTQIPPHLRLDIQTDYNALMSEIGRRSMGFDGVQLYGCAFIQGGRLQFTTAMPLAKMLEISEQHRAKKGANVAETLAQTNRAREPAHEKKIADYLSTTACVGEKFILPSFTFNFGVAVEEHGLDVSLILLDSGHDGSTTWPAVLLLPRSAKLETTDGAHRRNTIYEMLMGKKLSEESRDLLLGNAVDAKLVFESSAIDSHQDFADCGRTKPISKSQLAAYDARDSRNNIATTLAKTHPFLAEFVDGGSNNVNLTAKSHRVWSLAAVRTMVLHSIEKHPDASPLDKPSSVVDALRTNALGPFLDALVKEMPQLQALEANRKAKVADPQTESVTGRLREASGGDVALRAIGLFIFARAYVHCLKHNVSFEVMAKQLAKLNWHALDCAREDIALGESPDDYHTAVMAHANPLWRPLIVIKAKRYKISSSTDDANQCWDLIVNQMFPHAMAAE